MLFASNSYSPRTSYPVAKQEKDSSIHLLHSDVMYKTPTDPRATILIGNVKLLHNGTYLDCDSARYYKEENSFDAFGHVKMRQGDTLTLTSDTLYYKGDYETADAYGHCVMLHRGTKLVSSNLNYNKLEDKGIFTNGGTLYDKENVLVSDNGQYTPGLKEAFFQYNVELKGYEENDKNHKKDPKFTLISDTLYYYTDTQNAKIVSPTNITSNDGTFVYGNAGDYDTKHGIGYLLARSYIIKDMRKIVGDSLYSDKNTGVSEAFGDVILTDDENKCMLTGGYCSYNENTGEAVATDNAVAYEFSQSDDTLYVHGDTLKMFSFNMNTDSAYHDMHAYYKVRAYRTDIQAVCDSMVTHELDSCTYMYGQPILWNESQQIFGEEIHLYNNDSTLEKAHIINQAMTIEKIDSLCYNQVSSKEMFAYFKDGVLEHNEAKGNVFVCYYMNEDDGNQIGMDYTETTELKVYMVNKKVERIWMPAATGTIYPIFAIPSDKRKLTGFAWFDYIRPKDKNDIFEWRAKGEEDLLQKTEKKTVPLQKLSEGASKSKAKKDKAVDDKVNDNANGNLNANDNDNVNANDKTNVNDGTNENEKSGGEDKIEKEDEKSVSEDKKE